MAKDNQQNGGILYNALTSGSKIVGTITADFDFRIDGLVEGELICKGKMVIGPQGKLKGVASCQNAEILGTLDGKIIVEELLSIRETAKIIGEIETNTLLVEPKATINGSCKMGKAEPPIVPKK